MKQILFFLAVFFINPHSVSAQYGYLGRKNYFTAQGGLNFPMLTGTFGLNDYHASGDKMKVRKDYFDLGVSAEYMRSVDVRVSVGIASTYKRFTVKQDEFVVDNFDDNNGTESVDTTWLRIQNPKIEVLTLLPRVEIFRKIGNGPIGIYHEIGIGAGFTKLVNKDYDVSLNPINPNDESLWSTSDNYNIKLNVKSYKSIIFLYGVALRMPINDLLSFNLGARYSINIYSRPSDTRFSSNRTDLFDDSELFFRAQRANLLVIQLMSGLTLHF